MSVDSYLSDITEESAGSNNVSSSDKENSGGVCDEASFVSAKSVLSAYSSASAMLPTRVRMRNQIKLSLTQHKIAS